MRIRKAVEWSFIVFLLLMQGTHNQANAGEKEMSKTVPKELKFLRDQGIIGEKKTRVAPKTSAVRMYKEDESFVVPFVVDDEALFGGEFGGGFVLRYAFRFACLGWKYNIKAYLTNLGEKERSSSVVDLESPDKKTRVNVQLLDVALSAAFAHPLTEDQIQQQRAGQDKVDRKDQKTAAAGIIVASRYTMPYSDPLNREERILAGKEVISRLLGKGVDGYKLAEASPIKFSVEKVSDKEFVKAEAVLYAANLKKTCIVWALSVSGYRLKKTPDERRSNLWLCHVISDDLAISSIEVKAHRILETLRFAASDQNVYPDLRD